MDIKVDGKVVSLVAVAPETQRNAVLVSPGSVRKAGPSPSLATGHGPGKASPASSRMRRGGLEPLSDAQPVSPSSVRRPAASDGMDDMEAKRRKRMFNQLKKIADCNGAGAYYEDSERAPPQLPLARARPSRQMLGSDEEDDTDGLMGPPRNKRVVPRASLSLSAPKSPSRTRADTPSRRGKRPACGSDGDSDSTDDNSDSDDADDVSAAQARPAKRARVRGGDGAAARSPAASRAGRVTNRAAARGSESDDAGETPDDRSDSDDESAAPAPSRGKGGGRGRAGRAGGAPALPPTEYKWGHARPLRVVGGDKFYKSVRVTTHSWVEQGGSGGSGADRAHESHSEVYSVGDYALFPVAIGKNGRSRVSGENVPVLWSAG